MDGHTAVPRRDRKRRMKEDIVALQRAVLVVVPLAQPTGREGGSTEAAEAKLRSARRLSRGR